MTPSVALVQKGAFKRLSPRGTGRPAGRLGGCESPRALASPRHRPGIARALPSPGLEGPGSGSTKWQYRCCSTLARHQVWDSALDLLFPGGFGDGASHPRGAGRRSLSAAALPLLRLSNTRDAFTPIQNNLNKNVATKWNNIF